MTYANDFKLFLEVPRDVFGSWALWGAPWVPKFLPQSKTSLAPLGMVLKSVTISKQGRRNGFSKVAP